MIRLFDGFVNTIESCDESLRLILATAGLIAMITGGVALQNFFGGLMAGSGATIIGLSIFGLLYDGYLERKWEKYGVGAEEAEKTPDNDEN